MMSFEINQFEIRLLIALFLGAVIGLERQWQHKTAGIKTNALVSLGSALFVLLAHDINGDSSSESRIIAQIVSGIGFLGAGAIMKEGLNISGLNTAATIWCAGAIGSLSGLGMTYEAIIGTIILIIANISLRSISHKLENKLNLASFHYKIEIETNDSLLFNSEELIKTHPENLFISSSETQFLSNGNKIFTIEMKAIKQIENGLEKLLEPIKNKDGVIKVKWSISQSKI
jgi:putative Mg2+ transporter-C (MgtC) family protein